MLKFNMESITNQCSQCSFVAATYSGSKKIIEDSQVLAMILLLRFIQCALNFFNLHDLFLSKVFPVPMSSLSISKMICYE